MTESKIAWVGSLVLCAAVGYTDTIASAASAKATKQAEASKECMAQAKTQNPQTFLEGSSTRSNSPARATYRACMQKKGFKP